MTLIDQRILIDAPLHVVWKMLIDPRELRGWHAGYTSVSILTTHETGEGVRRRCGLSATGKDVFEEITVWVEGLGYEYRVVEGGPWRSLTGRFRLQAMPDGTSVQWVIAYQPKGVIGLVRDRFGGRRAMTEMMSASLAELRRRVNAMGVRMDDSYRERVGIRGRLDASERAHYQRRYPSAHDTGEGQAPVSAPAAVPSVPLTPVPSFVADLTDGESGQPDTKPRKPSGLAEAIDLAQKAQAPVIESPAAAPLLHEPPISPEDTPRHGVQPVVTADSAPAPAASPLPYSSNAADFARPESAPEVVPSAPVSPAPARVSISPALADDEDILDFHRQATPPRGMPAVRVETAATEDTPPEPEWVAPPDVVPPPEIVPPPSYRSEAPQPAAPISAARPAVPPPAEVGPVERAPARPPQTPKSDTGEMSIWEVFGVPRPSEQDAEALNTLIRTTQTRERAGLTSRDAQGSIRRVFRRPRRVRTLRRNRAGLRWRLALQKARIRLFWRRQ